MKAIRRSRVRRSGGFEAGGRSGSEAGSGRGARADPRRRRQPGRRLHSHRARTRASRRCRTRPDSTAPAKSKRSAPTSTRFAAGDRVYIAGAAITTAGAGTYAERAICAPSQLHRLPARASFAQGAALGVPYATAYRALFHRAAARPGETVLVHGATGGVGIAAVEIAHAHGMTVIGTGGTDARPRGGARARRRRRRQSPRRRTTPRRSCARPAAAAST